MQPTYRVNPLNITEGSEIEFEDVVGGKFNPTTRQYGTNTGIVVDMVRDYQGYKFQVLLAHQPLESGLELWKTIWLNGHWITRVLELGTGHFARNNNWLRYPVTNGDRINGEHYEVLCVQEFIAHVVTNHPKYAKRDTAYDVEMITLEMMNNGIIRSPLDRTHYGWPIFRVNRKRMHRWLQQNINRHQLSRKKREDQFAETKRMMDLHVEHGLNDLE